MKNYIINFLSIASIFVSSVSFSQTPTYKLDYGIAQPLFSPQSERFSTGHALSLKTFYSANENLDFGLSSSLLALPSNLENIKTGTAIGAGISSRIHASNKNTFVPWSEVDLQYVRTGCLDRASFSLSLGLNAPLNDSRSFRTGPFIKYQDVIQLSKEGYNTTDAHILIVGFNLEFGKQEDKQVKQIIKEPESKKEIMEIPIQQQQKFENKKKYEELPSKKAQDAAFILNAKVQFLVNSSELRAEAIDTLRKIITTLKPYKNWSLVIEGHASSEGPPEPYNLNLSKRRAQSVFAFLKANGLNNFNIQTEAFSSTRPVASNETEEGRSLNRRVEFVLNIGETKN